MAVVAVVAMLYAMGAVVATAQTVSENVVDEIERVWIKPIVSNHDKSIDAFNEISVIYNRKIARLEQAFVELGHEDLLTRLMEVEELAIKNAKEEAAREADKEADKEAAREAAKKDPLEKPRLSLVKPKD